MKKILIILSFLLVTSLSVGCGTATKTVSNDQTYESETEYKRYQIVTPAEKQGNWYGTITRKIKGIFATAFGGIVIVIIGVIIASKAFKKGY